MLASTCFEFTQANQATLLGNRVKSVVFFFFLKCILKVQGEFWLTSWPCEDAGCLLERWALVQSAEVCPKKTVILDTRQIVKGKV